MSVKDDAVPSVVRLLLPPLLPWIRTEFGLSFAALGFVMTVLFVISGITQMLAGFVVDRLGTGPTLARPPRELVTELDAAGLGVEPMDSRAAARAWGVLRSEGRRIAAALYPLG